MKKLEFSLVISDHALKYSLRLHSSICSLEIPKRHIRCRRTIQNFTRGACPRTPLAMLHGNDLQDSFLHESVESCGFSLVISEYALKYNVPRIRQFYLLAKNIKKTLQTPPNSTKMSKFSHGSIRSYRNRPCTFHAQEMLRQCGFCCYPSDTTMEKRCVTSYRDCFKRI